MVFYSMSIMVFSYHTYTQMSVRTVSMFWYYGLLLVKYDGHISELFLCLFKICSSCIAYCVVVTILAI